MSKLKGEKRNIEWSQLSYNWMSGCDGPDGDGVHCKGCYAKVMATRMKGRFGYPKGDPFKVVLHPDKLWGPFKKGGTHPLVRKVPTVYFNVSMGDWMYAEKNWRREALKIMKGCPQHIFVTLTKIYDRMWTVAYDSPLASDGVQVLDGQLNLHLSNEIPKNVIVGISVTNREQVRGIYKLKEVPAFTRLICFEPLLEDVSEDVEEAGLAGIGWIIIGKRTRQGRTTAFMPEKEWVNKLIALARELDIPVFLKPSMTERRWYAESIEETPYDRIREELQAQTKLVIPPPPGRMCGSGGIY